jgi:hypothetical protein
MNFDASDATGHMSQMVLDLIVDELVKGIGLLDFIKVNLDEH